MLDPDSDRTGLELRLIDLVDAETRMVVANKIAGYPTAPAAVRHRLLKELISLKAPDPAYAEAARFCIRDHAVTDAGCGFTSLYFRALPSHAIELASVYLDRNVASVLALAGDVKPSPQQKQDLAAFIHLCGAGPATAYARRHFQMISGERCGDHLVAAYISGVNAMKRQFLRLAADGRN